MYALFSLSLIKWFAINLRYSGDCGPEKLFRLLFALYSFALVRSPFLPFSCYGSSYKFCFYSFHSRLCICMCMSSPGFHSHVIHSISYSLSYFISYIHCIRRIHCIRERQRFSTEIAVRFFFRSFSFFNLSCARLLKDFLFDSDFIFAGCQPFFYKRTRHSSFADPFEFF